MRTNAVRDGDEWVINGQKNWITNAGVADFYVVFAKTDRESNRSTAFIVESDREGFDPGHLEKKLGIKGSPTGQPNFTDVRVPAENMIGEEGRGLGVALGTLERTRLGAAAQAVGIAQGATDYAVGYARERVTFGKPIMELQGIQFKLADMETQDGRGPRAPLPGLCRRRPLGAGPRQADLDGQAVRLGHRDGGDRGGRAGPRRATATSTTTRSSA